jgi:hypothetical protein
MQFIAMAVVSMCRGNLSHMGVAGNMSVVGQHNVAWL